ncbi:cytochrome c peroxidase [Methylomonas montana]|uniref:cytochrome-c peroxidase n=1 Tax=Methylomonas montana TaxID=3058963 RepID=UPI0026589B10|nr:cytochrome c peroxidase [Methylomonas montana]WKJ92123.1 cytochrome c peroxidase [Methylomonas montana]
MMRAIPKILMFSSLVLSSIVHADKLKAETIDKLGEKLFFDPDLSKPSGQSCSTCHSPAAGFADPNKALPVSRGVLKDRLGSRNAMTTAYTAYTPPLHFDPTVRPAFPQGGYVGGLFWDGRSQTGTLEEQAKQPFLNPLEMHNQDKSDVVRSVRRSSYAHLFRKVFGPQSLNDVDTAFQHIAEALAAYERSDDMNRFSAKYDYFLAGLATLTPAEERGRLLFMGKARCSNCHTPKGGPDGRPLFTSFGFQNLGVPKNPENPYYDLPPELNPDGADFVDVGLGAVVNDPLQRGKFKIPTLRNVEVTAPYMHNGVFKTLHEVVMFDNTRDVASWPPAEVPETVHRNAQLLPGTLGRLGLSAQEVDDIVTFLTTLTDGFRPETSPVPLP